MSSRPPVTVRVSHRFTASPERVFDAWLDPAKARQFLFTTPTGQMVQAETDPRVGGRFTFTDRRDGEDIVHTGEYLEIDRPRRLVFTLSVPKYSSDVGRVTIEIEPLDSGCELTLTNDGVPPGFEEPAVAGWSAILAGLAAVA
jgi:uncharacterized protein YndB with AHSA1/START domain